MITPLLILVALLLLLVIGLIIYYRPRPEIKDTSAENRLTGLQLQLDQIQSALREDFRINRDEHRSLAAESRNELSRSLRDLKSEQTLTLNGIGEQVQNRLRELTEQARRDSARSTEQLTTAITSFQDSFDRSMRSFGDLQREKFAQLEIKQHDLVKGTEQKLESIRHTVEEKLEKTLSERLGQSFETVGKQLIEVQRGLGEMQTLAQDVGGLKKVLSNVKMRGGFGEIQLSMLLEQILAPEQYESNVKTKPGGTELVEFAVRLPGRDEAQKQIWLPIDAKFPRDVYEQLQVAYDAGDIDRIEVCQKMLESTIRKMAKDICDKYINPPHTTDFAIMFLPFEGIYAEVVRKASLLEDLQRNCKVIVTGPTTLAAILNSLQMGFKTLAIQRRSGEVWEVLGAVKKEFESFGGLLSKAQNNIQSGLNQLDDVMGKRTKAIQRKLRGVEALNDEETRRVLPVTDPELLENSGDLQDLTDHS